jgi:hypothetical protein
VPMPSSLLLSTLPLPGNHPDIMFILCNRPRFRGWFLRFKFHS